jgi:hypothetical protein
MKRKIFSKEFLMEKHYQRFLEKRGGRRDGEREKKKRK